MHISRRDPTDDTADLSRQNLIIIVVSASVGGFLVIALFVRFIHLRLARSAARTAPLPPVQPLAHHREQQLARFYASRPSTAYETTNLHVPHPFVSSSSSFQGSNASLLGGPQESPSVSRHASSLTGCDTAEDVSLASPMAVNDLQLPNPNFHHGVGASGSSSSIASAENDPISPADISISTLSSSQSSSCMGSNATYRPPRRSTSQPRPPSSHSHSRQARPLSITSASTSLSKSSRTTLRSGVPHAPHNHIQIVLPAPLGLQPNRDPLSRRPQTYADSDGFSRLSVVDQWTPKTYRSEGSNGLENRTRSVSSSEPRPSISSQSSSRGPSTHLRKPRRTNSALSSTSSHNSSSSVSPITPFSVEYGSAPPVPRIPSMYNNATFDTSYHEHRGLGAPNLHHPDARGRHIGPSPPSFANPRSLSLPPSTADSGGFLQEHLRGEDPHPASGDSKYNAHT